MAVEKSPTTLRDLVVVGASAGGVAALPVFVSALPADLAAAVVVVQHIGASSPRHLVDITQRSTNLGVRWAKDGERLHHGEILFAPPGTHLLIVDGRTVLSPGPRENHAKPSINRLFRSAAAARGSGTIGVLLTGMLDDGVAGLDAIKWCGGATLVQDPTDAEYPDLPRNAIAAVSVDSILPLSRLGAAVADLAGTVTEQQTIPRELALHAELDQSLEVDLDRLDALGGRDTAKCPDCGGQLWRVRGSQEDTFRCFVGHAISPLTLLASQRIAAEEVLWAAVRTLEEHTFTLTSRALTARERGDMVLAERYERQVERLVMQANKQRQLIIEFEELAESNQGSKDIDR